MPQPRRLLPGRPHQRDRLPARLLRIRLRWSAPRLRGCHREAAEEKAATERDAAKQAAEERAAAEKAAREAAKGKATAERAAA